MRSNWLPPGSCAVQVSRQDDGNNAGVPPIGPCRHVVCFVLRVVAAAEDVRVLESSPFKSTAVNGRSTGCCRAGALDVLTTEVGEGVVS